MIVKYLNLQGSSCSKVLISAMCYGQPIYSVIWINKDRLKILCDEHDILIFPEIKTVLKILKIKITKILHIKFMSWTQDNLKSFTTYFIIINYIIILSSYIQLIPIELHILLFLCYCKIMKMCFLLLKCLHKLWLFLEYKVYFK